MTTTHDIETTARRRFEELASEARKIGREAGKAGRNLWLVGLGAVATVDEHGRELFTRLVERGERLEKKESRETRSRLRGAGDRLRAFGHETERRIENGVGSTLRRFGVPSHADVEVLIDRIEKLTHQVEELSAES